jgi:hypothetical protein
MEVLCKASRSEMSVLACIGLSRAFRCPEDCSTKFKSLLASHVSPDVQQELMDLFQRFGIECGVRQTRFVGYK